jgi:hypothetical protein
VAVHLVCCLAQMVAVTPNSFEVEPVHNLF